MTPTPARLDDLRQRLAALRTRFAEVGGRAAAAAAEVRASAAPAQALLDDLRETSADFDELRVALLEEASAFAGAPDPARIRTLKAPITLADGWNQLDDERCSSLHDAITQNFDRPLALAALRGKLGHEGEIIDAPEPTGFVPAAGYAPAAPDQTAPAAYVPAAPAEAAPEGYVAASAADDGPRFRGAAPAAGGGPVTGGWPAGGGGPRRPGGPAPRAPPPPRRPPPGRG